MCLGKQEWKGNIIFDHTRVIYYKYRREKMHLKMVGSTQLTGLGGKSACHGCPC